MRDGREEMKGRRRESEGKATGKTAGKAAGKAPGKAAGTPEGNCTPTEKRNAGRKAMGNARQRRTTTEGHADGSGDVPAARGPRGAVNVW
jgi:hypothetical protein